MVIAVDAMGGDIPVHAPVEAAVRAAIDFEQEIILVGNHGTHGRRGRRPKCR